MCHLAAYIDVPLGAAGGIFLRKHIWRDLLLPAANYFVDSRLPQTLYINDGGPLRPSKAYVRMFGADGHVTGNKPEPTVSQD